MSLRRALVAAVSVALVGLVFLVVLPRIASYSAVWHSTSQISPAWLVALIGLTAANVATFTLPWIAVLPGLGFVNALQMTQASTAFTFVMPGGAPLGMGVSFAMLRTWGFSRPEVGRAVALTGIWNQLSTFLFPVVAAVAVAAAGSSHSPVVSLVALLGVAIFLAASAAVVLVLRSNLVLLTIGRYLRSVAAFTMRLFRRPPAAWVDADLLRLRGETVQSIQATWVALTMATVANQLTSFAVLELSLRAVGISYGQVNLAESFAAWSVGRLIASLPLTPGGLGFIELGMTGLLVGFGGRQPQVVAGVLLYRILSLGSTSLVGAAALASWNRFRPGGSEAG